MVTVIKISGSVVTNDKQLKMFCEFIKNHNGSVVVVHGGGDALSKVLKKQGVENKKIEGRRITCEKTLKYAISIFNELNHKLTESLKFEGVNAIGLSGIDVVVCEKRKLGAVDFGFVGDVTNVEIDLLSALLAQGKVVVLNSLGYSVNGTLNVNADTIASEIAKSFIEDVELIVVGSTAGVLNASQNGNVISELSKQDFKYLESEGIVNTGMIVKLENCFTALASGAKVCICNVENLATRNIKTQLI